MNTKSILAVAAFAAIASTGAYADEADSWRHLAILGLLFGLDFSVHRTNALLIPGVLVWVLIRNPAAITRARTWMASLTGLAAGLSVQLLLIPIARITDEYLRYLRVMQEMDIAVAGDFLVMAATLIELKTKMLLPRDPSALPEAEEDPRSELVNQLLEYQKYKAAAQMLWSRATVEQAVFKRAELETDKNNPEVAVGLFDLLKVFQDILARHKEEKLLEIEREEISMAEMLERLRNMVMSSGELNLRVFFERARSRRELVLAFLSVLELVRTTEVKLFQRETFGDIIARASS